MRLSTTTGDYAALPIDLFDIVSDLSEVGFSCLDLSLYDIDRNPSPFMASDWQSYTARLSDHAASLGVTFTQAHSPGSYNPFSTGEAELLLHNATVRSIEVAGMLGIPYVVVHAGWAPGISRADAFARNRAFLSRFYPTMEKTGVRLLLENSTRVNMGDQYWFYDGDIMREFLDYANHPLLGACWDTGHAHLEGHQYADILALGDYLGGIHVHDNRHGGDEHLLPFTGSINMDEIMTALIDAHYAGDFTFECDSVFTPASARKPFEGRESRLGSPSRGMLRAAATLRYETGKHILTAYGLWEPED